MFPSCHGPRSRMGWLGGGADRSHRATKMPAREKAAQRHSPGGGREVRSADGIFLFGE